MNWDQLQGKWRQVKGSAKQHWGKFTDDDLEYIAGHRESLIGKLQERYGLAKEEAQRRADEWMKSLLAKGQDAGPPRHTTQPDYQETSKR
jgi:uncharacterized protein YjbJ (UPF0337 family)